ncbi:unannotated protein [freshwater metagenome]|uniref:Unannotated protein n=1 Tax=freshwater metagenome TaxID=449393 RepID=A0A6J7G1D9_9ZZZZ
MDQLPSGKWRARYRVDGLLKSAPMTFDSKTDAKLFLDSVRTDMTREVWKAPRKSSYTIEEYGTRWISQRPNLKNSTREQYETDWRLHIRPYLGKVRLDKLTPDQVRAWNAELANDLKEQFAEEELHRKKKSQAVVRDGSSTVSRSYRLLRAVMGTATDDELITANPCRIKGAGVTRSAERPTLSVSEVSNLVEALPDRYKALGLVLTWVGLRIGEAAALQRGDIDLTTGYATVTVNKRMYIVNNQVDIDTPKSKAGTRTVSIPPHLVPALQTHLDTFTGRAPSALVFTTSTGNHVRRGYSEVFNRALARIGRPDVRVHDSRHTGMTLASQAGASVADLKQRLGQSSTAAAEIYMHATKDHGREVANRMSELAEVPDNVVAICKLETK